MPDFVHINKICRFFVDLAPSLKVTCRAREAAVWQGATLVTSRSLLTRLPVGVSRLATIKEGCTRVILVPLRRKEFLTELK